MARSRWRCQHFDAFTAASMGIGQLLLQELDRDESQHLAFHGLPSRHARTERLPLDPNNRCSAIRARAAVACGLRRWDGGSNSGGSNSGGVCSSGPVLLVPSISTSGSTSSVLEKAAVRELRRACVGSSALSLLRWLLAVVLQPAPMSQASSSSRGLAAAGGQEDEGLGLSWSLGGTVRAVCSALQQHLAHWQRRESRLEAARWRAGRGLLTAGASVGRIQGYRRAARAAAQHRSSCCRAASDVLRAMGPCLGDLISAVQWPKMDGGSAAGRRRPSSESSSVKLEAMWSTTSPEHHTGGVAVAVRELIGGAVPRQGIEDEDRDSVELGSVPSPSSRAVACLDALHAALQRPPSGGNRSGAALTQAARSPASGESRLLRLSSRSTADSLSVDVREACSRLDAAARGRPVIASVRARQLPSAAVADPDASDGLTASECSTNSRAGRAGAPESDLAPTALFDAFCAGLGSFSKSLDRVAFDGMVSQGVTIKRSGATRGAYSPGRGSALAMRSVRRQLLAAARAHRSHERLCTRELNVARLQQAGSAASLQSGGGAGSPSRGRYTRAYAVAGRLGLAAASHEWGAALGGTALRVPGLDVPRVPAGVGRSGLSSAEARSVLPRFMHG